MKNDFLKEQYAEYLKAHCVGRENAVNRAVLAKRFNTSIAEQKTILAAINADKDSDLIISTCGGIYVCTTESEIKTAAFNEIKSGLSRLKKGRAMLAKYYKDGQTELTFDGVDIYKLFKGVEE